MIKSIKTEQAFFCIIFLFVNISCNENKGPTSYQYGSSTPQAVESFVNGWEYILDFGQWSLAEKSFRKALELDSNFVIAKSVVGKISIDLPERLKIYQEVQEKYNSVSHDNQLLLDITLATLELFNARDQGHTISPQFMSEFYNKGVDRYKEFVQKYPDESYMKAEYIEFIHAVEGPRAALDSLENIVSDDQKELPFFINYRAIMESEIGQYSMALQKAKRLSELLDNSIVPAPNVLYAQIYWDMDSLSLAKSYIEKSLKLDHQHIIAQRLKDRIDRKIQTTHE